MPQASKFKKKLAKNRSPIHQNYHFMKRLLLFLFGTILSVNFMLAQTVSGTVTDADSGDPLIGVIVMVEGTTEGMITDEAGKYNMSVPKGATALVFTYYGKKTVREEINGRTSIDVKMAEDAANIDEQVITALGISRSEKEIGYAAQNVGGAALVKSGETNMVAGLSGKVAGVQIINSGGTPGSSAFIRIRGGSSITGSNQPLFVIDGVPVDNSQLSSGNPDNGSNNYLGSVGNSNRAIDINPSDIKNLTVLKGAAATALYGIRASNGAILIETFKGGDTKGKVNVNFNTSYTVDNVNKMPDLQMAYGQGRSGRYYGPENQGAATAFRSWGPKIDTLAFLADPNYIWDTRGKIVGKSTAGAAGTVSAIDNAANFFQPGSTWNNSVSFAGGNTNTNFRLSLANLTQKGVVPNSTFNRNNISFAGQSALTDKFKVSSSVNYSNSGGVRIQQGSNTSGLMLGLMRTPITFDNANGATEADDTKGYEFADGTQRSYAGIFDNPYWTINKNKFQDNVNRVFGNVQFDYLPFTWMAITYRLGTDFYSDSRQQNFAVNSASQPAGQVFNQTYLYQHLNSDLFVTLNKKLGSSLDASLMLGNNVYNRNIRSNYTEGNSLTIPNFYHISNASSVLSRQSIDQYRSRAAFADARLSYKNWLFVNGTYRQEMSSVLDGRSFGYGSANLGIVFTEPLGLTDSKYLSYGKLRFSYGVVGNDQGLTYATKNYYTLASYADGWTNGIAYPFMGTPGFTSSDVLGNPNLLPEKTTSIEVGTDLRFFQGRLNLDLTYYNTQNKNQIVSSPVSGSTGYLSQVVNLGSIRNRGIEAVLSFSPIKTKSFEWESTINFTRNRSLVESINNNPNDTITISLGGFEGSDIRAVEGQPYGMFYGEKWLRDKSGNIVISTDPSTGPVGYPAMAPTTGPIGNPNPDFLAGWRNTFTYKGLSVSALLDIKKGGIIWNGTLGAMSSYGTSKNTEYGRMDSVIFGGNMVLADGSEVEDGRYSEMFKGAVYGKLDDNGNVVYTDKSGNTVTSPVENTTKVKFGESWYRTGYGSGFNGPAELYVEDGSFVRLRELSLSYELNKNWLDKSPIKGVSIGISGRNLFLWTKYRGVDPETSLVGSRNAQGLDYFNMPNTRSMGFSLNMKF